MASLKVRGVPGVLKALEQFEPELAKQTAKALSKKGRDIAADAKREIPTDSPLRNWRGTFSSRSRGKRYGNGAQSSILSRGGQGWPPWNSAAMRASVKSRRRDLTLTVTMNEAAANIYAIAGTKSDGRSPQGRAMIANLPEITQGGGSRRKGRVMVPAVRSNYKDTRELIENELFDVIAQVNRKVA